MSDAIRALLERLWAATYDGPPPDQAALAEVAPFLRFVLPEDEWEQGEPQ